MLSLAACHVDTAAAQITLTVHSTQVSVPCPLCATPARCIHSRYTRTLADLFAMLTHQYAHTTAEVEARIDRLSNPLLSPITAYHHQRDQSE